MRRITTAGLMLVLGCGLALAQGSGGSSSGGASGGGTSGGASGGAPSGAAPSGSAPAGSQTSPTRPSQTGPAANPALTPAPRTNTEVPPPSRQLPATAPRSTAPGGLPQPGTGSGASNPAATTPGAQQSGVEQAPDAAGGSRPQPGGANSSAESRDKRTGKNAAKEEYADCMRLWEPATHMTRDEWSRTCRRVQSRLNSVQTK